MPDPLSLYQELFPLMTSVRIWDLEDGDAQFMRTVQNEYYDFVHSSHCLEHLVDPKVGINNWFRILKPNGYLIVTIPDEDMYEQGIWPSNFNLDHKWSFTIYKKSSWSPNSVNIIDLLQTLGNEAQIIAIQLINSAYRYSLPRYDQTATPVAESAIEFIIKKNSTNAAIFVRNENNQPDPSVRKYYNQYMIDYKNLKKDNKKGAPFTDASEI